MSGCRLLLSSDWLTAFKKENDGVDELYELDGVEDFLFLFLFRREMLGFE